MSEQPFSTKTVLVVEDETPLFEAIKRKLELQGFRVVIARSVSQALGYLEDIPSIDLIWLDHLLLGRDTGLDFVASVKSNPQWSELPIFVVSNSVSDEKVNSYLQLGATKFYTKVNYRLDQIIEDVKHVITQKDAANT
jgi:CheY-like chemotaxis protein